ncbi:hypothetical protein [Pararhizobium gei]|uniref:hypothetical protein n=1 Tax=Pararhizobium gei TaxID=1395951 RepID=UPI0023DB3212|nr:hypothetical protein [Rhizobium gei]
MTALRTFALSVFLSAACLATPAVAEPFFQPSDAYADLPGVKAQEDVDRENAVTCREVLVRRDTGINSGYRMANFCRRGSGPIFQSGRLPPSIIRQLRGFNY